MESWLRGVAFCSWVPAGLNLAKTENEAIVYYNSILFPEAKEKKSAGIEFDFIFKLLNTR
jgi:hypothetical protein